MSKVASKALQFTRSENIPYALQDLGNCHITILGIGGAGNNTINRLLESGNTNAKCIAINTDMQHLMITKANQKILIGEKLTRGVGSGGDPKIGKGAIEESAEKVKMMLDKVDIAFITAGMGGGTGTGAAPIVARLASENGAIVIGVVTMPFKIEKGRIAYAIKGLAEMKKECDTVIVIDNNKLIKLVPQLPINEAFKVGDNVLASMMAGITDTISLPSLINLDFADFRTIIKKGGIAVAGVGQSGASNRAEEAVKKALRIPLLDVDYVDAKGALIHVSGDDKMTIDEVNRVGEIVTKMMSDDSLVIWGARVNPNLKGVLKVTLIITGVRSKHPFSNYNSPSLDFPEIYQMDSSIENESTLNLDFGLYKL